MKSTLLRFSMFRCGYISKQDAKILALRGMRRVSLALN